MRIDKNALLSVIGTHLTEDEGKRWMKLPLIVIPPALVQFNNGELIHHVPGNPWSEFVAFNSEDPEVLDALVEFPFEEFLTYHPLRENSDFPAVYVKHTLNPDMPELYEQCMFGFATADELVAHVRATVTQVPETPEGKNCYYQFWDIQGAKVNDASTIVGESRNLLASWMVYTDSLKLFPVVQTPPPKKIGKKASYRVQVKEHNSPVVLFLGKLPTKTESGANLPTVASHKKAPHQRIAHYKTLTHERYRNHPKYMVPNGVRVRSAWVGDVTAIDREGATYKVVM